MGTLVPRRLRSAVYFRRWNSFFRCLLAVLLLCLVAGCYVVMSRDFAAGAGQVGRLLRLEREPRRRYENRDAALGSVQRGKRHPTSSRKPLDPDRPRRPLGPGQLGQGQGREQWRRQQGLESEEDKERARLVEELVKKYWVDYSRPLPPDQSAWEVARTWVSRKELLPDHAPELGSVLREAATAPIEFVDDGGQTEGNQLKLLLTLRGGQKVVFKPKWYDREDVWTGNMCDMHDRHNAEIAAFHLSRLLGFRKTALAVGRVLRLSYEVIPVASQSFLETFYKDTATNETCFYGHCGYCPTEPHHKHASICTSEDSVEGAVILWLPDVISLHDDRYHSTHPWMRICYDTEPVRRILEKKDYCQSVQRSRIQPTALAEHDDRYLNPFYNNTGLFLDFLDSTILHYLTANADRKVTWVTKGPYENLLVMMDNGKSFHHPDRDEWLLLAPLFQCCMVRNSTYRRLRLLNATRLSHVMRRVMEGDPVSPVLSDPQLLALDRRLGHVLHQIQRCLDANGHGSVLR